MHKLIHSSIKSLVPIVLSSSHASTAQKSTRFIQDGDRYIFLVEDNRTSKVTSVSSGTDARSAKATDEAAGDTVPDEEGEDGGERNVFLFLIYFIQSSLRNSHLGNGGKWPLWENNCFFFGEQRCFQKMPVLACVNQNANTAESTDARYRMIQYKGHDTHEYKLFFLAKI